MLTSPTACDTTQLIVDRNATALQKGDEMTVHTSNLRGLAGAAKALIGQGLQLAGYADPRSRNTPWPAAPRQGHTAPSANPQPSGVGGFPPDDVPQLNDALHAKMTRLLNRSLEQNTCDTRLELYDRIIDQLVADEARILRALSDGTTSPLVNVYSKSRWRSAPQAVLTSASLVGRSAGVTLPDMESIYVANLLQLGLIEIGPEDTESTTGYEVLLAEPIVLHAIDNAGRGRHSARVERLSLRLSELGSQLWMATMGHDAIETGMRRRKFGELPEPAVATAGLQIDNP